MSHGQRSLVGYSPWSHQKVRKIPGPPYKPSYMPGIPFFLVSTNIDSFDSVAPENLSHFPFSNLLKQGLANFSSKGPDNEYFRILRIYVTWHTYSILCAHNTKTARDKTQTSRRGCVSNYLQRNRQPAGFGWQTTVCPSLPGRNSPGVL